MFSPYGVLPVRHASVAAATTRGFDAVTVKPTGYPVSELLRQSVAAEHQRCIKDDDDAEGQDLSYDSDEEGREDEGDGSASVSSTFVQLSDSGASPSSSAASPPLSCAFSSLSAVPSSPSTASARSPAADPSARPPESVDIHVATHATPVDASKKKKNRRSKRKGKACDDCTPPSAATSSGALQAMPSTMDAAQPHTPTKRTLTRQKLAFYERRKRNRKQENTKTKDPADYKLRSSLSKRPLALGNIKLSFKLRDLSWAKGAFIGHRDVVNPCVPTLDDLKEEGFEIFEWEGRCVFVESRSLRAGR